MPLSRLKPSSLLPEWRLPPDGTFGELNLNMCQLSKLPKLQDGTDLLKPPKSKNDEEGAYAPPADLSIDEVDQQEGAEDDAEDVDPPGDRVPKGTPCVSITVKSNHLKQLEKRALEGVPFLCSLDLSTNHISWFELAADTAPRLTTLSLRNNSLSEVGPIARLGNTLRRLDLSFNQLTSLKGVDKLHALRILLASGNQLTGELPVHLNAAKRLVLVDLSHNKLDGSCSQVGNALSGLTKLSTLKLAHNMLPPRALPHLVATLGKMQLRRLELYSNPLAEADEYPDVLLQVQPKLVTLDHMRQPAGELAAGMQGTASSRSVAEAVDAVANSALSQHAVLLEEQKAKHAKLLDTLVAQQAAAAAAIEQYVAITNATIAQFKAGVAEAKRTGSSEKVVDKVLTHRQELLNNEKMCCERYRKKMEGSITEVSQALAKLQEGSDRSVL